MDRFRSFEEQLTKPIRVLLVDDEVEFASIIAEMLEDRGLKVTRVENGMEAAKIAAKVLVELFFRIVPEGKMQKSI